MYEEQVKWAVEEGADLLSLKQLNMWVKR